VFRRLFWLLVGAGLGFGLSFWMMRVIRQTAARWSPERVSTDLAGAARVLGQDLRRAAAEGRDAMRDREAELREELSLAGARRGRDGR